MCCGLNQFSQYLIHQFFCLSAIKLFLFVCYERIVSANVKFHKNELNVTLLNRIEHSIYYFDIFSAFVYIFFFSFVFDSIVEFSISSHVIVAIFSSLYCNSMPILTKYSPIQFQIGVEFKKQKCRKNINNENY